MFIRNFFLSRRGLVCAVLLFVASTGLQAQPANTAPLVEDVFPQLKPIMEKAMTQSPQMIQRNINIAEAEANRIVAGSVLLPSVSGSVSYSSSTAAVSSNTDVSSRASGIYYAASASQPIFAWGTLKAQTETAKVALKMAEKNYAEGYRQLALTIRKLYMRLVINKIAFRNAEFALQLAQSNLSIEEERLRTGRISPGGIIPPRLAVDEARLGRDGAEAALDESLRAFKAITGVAEIDVSAIPMDLTLPGLFYNTDYAKPLLADFLSSGIEYTLQAQVYRDYIQQANLNYKIQKYRLYPKFNMGLNYSLSNSTQASLNTVQQVGVTNQAITITGVWTIFDGFATKGIKRSALLAKRTYEQTLESYLRDTGNQVTDLERQLNFAARTMQLADTRRDIQAGAVKLVEQDRARGVGSQLTVDSTRSLSYQSDLRAVMARAEFLARWAEFLSAVGLDPALKNLHLRYRSHVK